MTFSAQQTNLLLTHPVNALAPLMAAAGNGVACGLAPGCPCGDQEQLRLSDPIYVSLDGVEPTSVLGHRASGDAEPVKVTKKKRNRARGPRKRPGVVPPGKDGKNLAEREAAAKEFCALEKVDANKTLLDAMEEVATLQE